MSFAQWAAATAVAAAAAAEQQQAAFLARANAAALPPRSLLATQQFTKKQYKKTKNGNCWSGSFSVAFFDSLRRETSRKPISNISIDTEKL